MKKQSAKLILNITSIILVIGGAFLFYNKSIIKADSELGVFKSEKEFGFELNNKKFKFRIKSYSKDGLNKNYIIRSSFFKTKQVELLGFEDDYNLCSKPTIKLKDKEIICLLGDVGVHSQVVSFINQDLSNVAINDNGAIKYSLTTDTPSYQILDYNNDGYDDLIIDNRDYDKNPLVNIHRAYYSSTNNGFIFDKVERVEVK